MEIAVLTSLQVKILKDLSEKVEKDRKVGTKIVEVRSSSNVFTVLTSFSVHWKELRQHKIYIVSHKRGTNALDARGVRCSKQASLLFR